MIFLSSGKWSVDRSVWERAFPLTEQRPALGPFGFLNLGEGFLGGGAEGATGVKVGNVGDIRVVFFRMEDIDVIIFHDQS